MSNPLQAEDIRIDHFVRETSLMKKFTGYRADIDGLRAVAVLGVLLFHYGASWLPGGFTGVDVFFVISGFVITAKLRRDMAAGEYSIVTFYVGRVRRIVPALVTVLLVTMLTSWFILMPGDYSNLGKSAAFAAVGLANIFFFWNTGYFDQASELQPLLHTWSLGVEEQFYAVWPLALLLLSTKVRSQRSMTLVLLAVVIAAFVYAAITVHYDPKAAFYLPHLRAWELLLGALVAFAPLLRIRFAAQVTASIGAALIVYSFVGVSAADPFPGINAAYACFGAALICWPKEQTILTSILSLKPVVSIGRVSFSLYLWHWPVLVLFRHVGDGARPSFLEACMLCLATFALSYLSWYFVEQPFRRPAKDVLRTFGGGVSAILSIVILGSALTILSGIPQRIPAEVRAVSSLDTMWKWDCPKYRSFKELGDLGICEFGKPLETARTKAFLWGDSHSFHMVAELEQAGLSSDASFLLYYQCPAVVGDVAHYHSPTDPTHDAFCGKSQENAIAFLNAHPEINLVLLPSNWSAVVPQLYADDPSRRSTEIGLDLLSKGLSRLIEKIAAPGRRIVLMGAVPQFVHAVRPLCHFDDVGLLRKSCTDDRIRREDWMSRQGPADGVLRSLSNLPNVKMISLGEAMCQQAECLDVLDGEYLYLDGSHIRSNLKLQTRKDLAQLFGFYDLLQP